MLLYVKIFLINKYFNYINLLYIYKYLGITKLIIKNKITK